MFAKICSTTSFLAMNAGTVEAVKLQMESQQSQRQYKQQSKKTNSRQSTQDTKSRQTKQYMQRAKKDPFSKYYKKKKNASKQLVSNDEIIVTDADREIAFSLLVTAKGKLRTKLSKLKNLQKLTSKTMDEMLNDRIHWYMGMAYLKNNLRQLLNSEFNFGFVELWNARLLNTYLMASLKRSKYGDLFRKVLGNSQLLQSIWTT
jgi:hypothetical protein